MSEVTRILSAIEQGDPHATEQLLPLNCDEHSKLAAHPLASITTRRLRFDSPQAGWSRHLVPRMHHGGSINLKRGSGPICLANAQV
jgi:hypothetical protein